MPRCNIREGSISSTNPIHFQRFTLQWPAAASAFTLHSAQKCLVGGWLITFDVLRCGTHWGVTTVTVTSTQRGVQPHIICANNSITTFGFKPQLQSDVEMVGGVLGSRAHAGLKRSCLLQSCWSCSLNAARTSKTSNDATNCNSAQRSTVIQRATDLFYVQNQGDFVGVPIRAEVLMHWVLDTPQLQCYFEAVRVNIVPVLHAPVHLVPYCAVDNAILESTKANV